MQTAQFSSEAPELVLLGFPTAGLMRIRCSTSVHIHGMDQGLGGLSSTPPASTASAPASTACSYMEVGSYFWQTTVLTDLSLCQVKT